MYITMVACDNPMDNCQAKSSPFAHLFGSEVGVKNFLLECLIHATASVTHLEANIFSWRDFYFTNEILFINSDILQGNSQYAT